MKSEQVGARVKEMRKALGMKQDELSSILGIGKSALSILAFSDFVHLSMIV